MPPDPAYPKTLETLGDYVRKERLDRGLFQPDAAREIGCHPRTVMNWELGHADVAVRYVPNVIAFLGYDPRPEPKTEHERCAFLRIGAGLSQLELGHNLALDPVTICCFESGEMMSPKTRSRIHAFLDAAERGDDLRSFVLARQRPHNRPPEKLETLGDHVRAERLRRGLTQSQAGKHIGCTQMTVTNIELGRSQVSVKLIPGVLAFLGYNPLAEGKTLGERVKRARRCLGLSQAGLAYRLGIKEATLRRAERGDELRPGIDVLLEDFVQNGGALDDS